MTKPKTKPAKAPKAAKKSELSPTLATITLAEARASLEDLDQAYGIVPGSAREHVSTAAATVLSKAATIGITNVKQLIEHLPDLLKAISGVESVTEFQRTVLANPLHLHRNVATAIAVAAAAENGCSTEAVWARAVRLPRRSARRGRPCMGDEILLLRVHALLASDANPTSKPAMAYALAETGLYPSETTTVCLEDLDHTLAVTQIKAVGHKSGVHSRHLPITDPFNQHLITRRAHAALVAGDSQDTTLSYDGRKNAPGSNEASASASGVLDRMLTEVGIKNGDLTAGSITSWRLQTIYAEHDIDTAWKFSGRSSKEQTLNMLFGTVKAPRKKNQKLVRAFPID